MWANDERQRLIHIDVGFACAGVIINKNGIIVKTAPIFKYSIGHTDKWLKNYLEKRGILKSWTISADNYGKKM